jgi:hypothetical protein
MAVKAMVARTSIAASGKRRGSAGEIAEDKGRYPFKGRRGKGLCWPGSSNLEFT